MSRADRIYREMMMSGRSMGRRVTPWRRRLERALGVLALGAVALAFAWALARALDSEAALWHVGDYGRVTPEEEVESWR